MDVASRRRTYFVVSAVGAFSNIVRELLKYRISLLSLAGGFLM